MKNIRVIAANMLQGFIFAGKVQEEQAFSRFSPQDYIDYFKKQKPDILAIEELLFDNGKGESQVGENIAKELQLPYWRTFSPEKSWIYNGKYYGQGLFSKFPLTNYKTILLPNPKLEITRPDGSYWILHDRGIQSAIITLNKQKIAINNIHGFPFHHFKRQLNEPEFTHIRQAIMKSLIPDKNMPTIVAGDFNTKHITIEESLPDLFVNNLFKQAIKTETTLVFGNDQLDHILYTQKNIKCITSSAEKFLSDHYALIADFSLQKEL